MSNKNYRNDRYDKFQQFDDDFEDFGYEVKNIRRQTKKKVTKFKKEVDEYYDTY
jgi:ribosome recycling factor